MFGNDDNERNIEQNTEGARDSGDTEFSGVRDIQDEAESHYVPHDYDDHAEIYGGYPEEAVLGSFKNPANNGNDAYKNADNFPIEEPPDVLDEAPAPPVEAPAVHETPVTEAERVSASSAQYAAQRKTASGNRNKREKKGGAIKWVAIIAVAVALIVLSSVVAMLVSGNDISLTDWSGGLDIFTRPGSSANASPSPKAKDNDRIEVSPGDTIPPATKAPDNSSTGSGVASGPIGSGFTLEIIDIPAESPDELELSLQDIYKKNVPSIVGIEAVVDGGYYTGTGIIMSEDGFIVTNAHVIEGAEKILVTLYNDDAEYDASLVGSDAQSDLAVLKIEASGLTAAEFGNSDILEVGDKVVAIGNPLGQNLTMTDGIISATSREITYDGYSMTLLQTNAAINEGNSGGPLINMYGQVIGITNMKMISYYSSIEGIGFAIPSAFIKTIVDELLEQGYISGRPTIGITVIALNEYVARQYGVDITSGVYVASVDEGSDAYKKGLRTGDIITAVEGEAITTVAELQERKNELGVGDTLNLTIYRDGGTFALDIMLVDSATIG